MTTQEKPVNPRYYDWQCGTRTLVNEFLAHNHEKIHVVSIVKESDIGYTIFYWEDRP